VESRVEYLKSVHTYMDTEVVAVEVFKAAYKTRSLQDWANMAVLLEKGDLVVRPRDHMSGFSLVVNNRECWNLL
jgi:hypothetical protein